MADFLGEKTLTVDERVELAQLTNQPGWNILVRLLSESCRNATEACIRLDPVEEGYERKVAALQAHARTLNKFSNDLIQSVKAHRKIAMDRLKEQENPSLVYEPPKRFQMVVPGNPIPEKEQQ
ncbi:Uncharacterised protein [uncultured archaeon]|nr:Uncharacterised protein [uncultured archaeon]